MRPSDIFTYIDMEPYVWEGSGSPCLPEPLANPLIHPHNPYANTPDGNNVVVSGPTEIPIPTEPSSIFVEAAKWSFLPDYEPDISDPANPQPNGYPDPTWEPAAP